MIYNLTLIGSIILLCFILNLVKKNKIDKFYSILWILLSLIVLFISIFPSSITKIAQKLGLYYQHTLLVFLGILILGIYSLYSAVAISKQNKMIIKLTQEIALMKNKEK